MNPETLTWLHRQRFSRFSVVGDLRRPQTPAPGLTPAQTRARGQALMDSNSARAGFFAPRRLSTSWKGFEISPSKCPAHPPLHFRQEPVCRSSARGFSPRFLTARGKPSAQIPHTFRREIVAAQFPHSRTIPHKFFCRLLPLDANSSCNTRETLVSSWVG